MTADFHRRRLLTAGVAGAAAASVALIGCAKEDDEHDGGDVGAVEDLMREHGVIRRILVVYSEVARKLAGTTSIDAASLGDAARLFREFGEDYHERALEEQHIFPQLRAARSPASPLVDTLLTQHQRGRSVTDYVFSVASKGSIGTGDAKPLSDALSNIVRMYEPHAAWEDTVVFPAWKEALGKRRVAEMGEKFEDIEHQRFGKDGFDDAVQRVGAIEQRLGLHDLASFTAPDPGVR
jgi:hemerythrin-like domain-containing protein